MRSQRVWGTTSVSLIYWDSMLFVYWLEEHAEYSRVVDRILDRMEVRGDRLCTSAFTVGEVLTGPKKSGHTSAVQKFREFFELSKIEVLPYVAATAEHYSQVRASNRVSPADAIHLASAAHAGVDLFLTNDKRLRGFTVPGIHFIADMHADLL
jgi:predicted nucleic acid-binding protein